MCTTYTCVLKEGTVVIASSNSDSPVSLTRAAFQRLIPRRQRQKLSTATQIAVALFTYFDINEKLRCMGADPRNTPIAIFNRYANWDYVASAMCPDIAVTLDGVNNYVAIAWFPATIQGFLTIEYGNIGEAITIASSDIELQTAAAEGLFARDAEGKRVGSLILGTFECIPDHIGGQMVVDAQAGAFGAISLISADDADDTIPSAIATHQRMYEHVTA